MSKLAFVTEHEVALEAKEAEYENDMDGPQWHKGPASPGVRCIHFDDLLCGRQRYRLRRHVRVDQLFLTYNDNVLTRSHEGAMCI